jgi:SAM-dependent methyltransferase
MKTETLSPTTSETQLRSNVACRVCAASGPHKAWNAVEMMYGTREQFTYFQCRACQCLQIEIIPADLSRYYRTDYYSLSTDHAAAYGHALKNTANRWRDQLTLFVPGAGRFPWRVAVPSLRAAFDALRRVPTLKLKSRIVDVGCGAGQLLFRMHNAGFSSLLGIDPFVASDREVAPGFSIRKEDLSNLDGQFDLIMMHHSFEHVPDPTDTASQLRDRLTLAGMAMVRIPVADCDAWDRYRENWFQLDAPRHLYLHTRESMRILAGRSGLRIVAAHCDSDFNQFLISERYRQGLPMVAPPGVQLPPFDVTPAQLAYYRKAAESLNVAERGDQMVFYLQRDG